LHSRFRQEAPHPVKEISGAALDASRRRLPATSRAQNIVERAVYMAQGEVLTAADVDARCRRGQSRRAPRRCSRSRTTAGCRCPSGSTAFEAWLCKDALERTRYKQKEAAALLGLSYDQFASATASTAWARTDQARRAVRVPLRRAARWPFRRVAGWPLRLALPKI